MVRELRLYITGSSASSDKLIKTLEEIIKNELDDRYTLKVMDILKHPQLAEDEKIMATPMLEKKLPPPVRRIIGELKDKEKILVGLDLIGGEK